MLTDFSAWIERMRGWVVREGVFAKESPRQVRRRAKTPRGTGGRQLRCGERLERRGCMASD
ncbi:MAG TPA: hypothetical protein PLV92_28435, partial [Pirellulaceae bacterium]|nr:hypothetical protein [Pirellulaceae bacterium]